MNRIEFIRELDKRFQGLNDTEVNKVISFYSELIDDRIEEGMSEQEAVESLGDIDSIVKDTMEQMPLSTLIQQKVENKVKSKALRNILIICGFPLWFPLLIAFSAIIFALYIVLWAVIVSFFASVISFAAAGVFSIIFGIAFCFLKGLSIGFAIIGAGLVLSGLFLITFQPMILLSKKAVVFTGFIIKKIKGLFIVKKEDVE